MPRLRLDKAVQQRGLAPSRSRAAQLITSGAVFVDGVLVCKPSAGVADTSRIELTREDPWVSRAAHKLLGALEAFPQIRPAGARCLDAGASTGGFTQVLLHQGAAHVVAVDVGHDQLAATLREHPQVTRCEGLNLRNVQPDQLGARFDLIVADLSFISLKLVIGPLAGQATHGADLLLMVKPQFEVGRDQLGRTGVVTNPQLRRGAVEGVIAAAEEAGLAVRGAARSPLSGQDGNAEFFLHLRRPPEKVSPAADSLAVDNDLGVPARTDRLDGVEFGET